MRSCWSTRCALGTRRGRSADSTRAANRCLLDYVARCPPTRLGSMRRSSLRGPCTGLPQRVIVFAVEGRHFEAGTSPLRRGPSSRWTARMRRSRCSHGAGEQLNGRAAGTPGPGRGVAPLPARYAFVGEQQVRCTRAGETCFKPRAVLPQWRGRVVADQRTGAPGAPLPCLGERRQDRRLVVAVGLALPEVPIALPRSWPAPGKRGEKASPAAARASRTWIR